MAWTIRKFITELGLKSFIKPIYHNFWVKPRKARRVKKFQKSALPVLEHFDQTMSQNGFNYCLIFGSLLGAVREKGFLKHDDDVDVAMWNADWSPKMRHILESNGFKLVHSFLVDNGKSGREETYKYGDIQIDIFYFYEAIDEYPYTCVFGYQSDTGSHEESTAKYGGSVVLRYQMPLSKKFHYANFETIKLPVPENPEKDLACTYGEDFMIPKPNWIGGSYKKYRTDWNGKLGVFHKIAM